MDRSGDDQWRPLVAALANDRVREAFARLTLGASADDALDGLSPSRRRHVVGTLQRAGLVTDDLRADGGAFARALAAAPSAPRPTGIARYLSREGGLIGYPSNPDERRELLTLLATRVLAPRRGPRRTRNQRAARGGHRRCGRPPTAPRRPRPRRAHPVGYRVRAGRRPVVVGVAPPVPSTGMPAARSGCALVR